MPKDVEWMSAESTVADEVLLPPLLLIAGMIKAGMTTRKWVMMKMRKMAILSLRLVIVMLCCPQLVVRHGLGRE